MSLKDIYNQKIYPNLYFAGQRLERIPYHIYAGKYPLGMVFSTVRRQFAI